MITIIGDSHEELATLQSVINAGIFELEEIKEIADYLMVYYQAHINEV